MMKLWMVLIVAGAVLTACQALTGPDSAELVASVVAEVENAVQESADAGEILTRQEVQALVEQLIQAETAGTPLEGAGMGAVATAVMGLLGTFLADRRKQSRKRGEMWRAIEEARGKTA